MSRQNVVRIMAIGGVLAIGLFILTTPGCNTIEGIGEDVSAAGKAVDQGAEETNPYEEENQ